jgi:hypothetical protein
MRKTGRLKIVGTGKNLVDVTYIQNAVEGTSLAFEKLSPQSSCLPDRLISSARTAGRALGFYQQDSDAI